MSFSRTVLNRRSGFFSKLMRGCYEPILPMLFNHIGMCSWYVRVELVKKAGRVTLY